MRNDLFNMDKKQDLSDPDPVRRAQIQSKMPLPKRFYKEAAVAEHDGQFAVELDGRAVKTPARQMLALPTRAAAQLIADEFSAQEKEIDPARMPATRLANTAIDGIVNDPQAVLEDVLRFASSDMLCYRAGSPERLVNRQRELWDPLIDWAASELGARFVLAEGVMHVEQPREALGAFSVHLGQFNDPFAIAALHTITTLTGSAIMALAVAKGEISGEEAWRLAHVDEDWTIEHWGEDAEAAARRALREREMTAAVKMLEAVSAS
ncbi:ATP12 family chaperone protein [Phyllobacterium bourgognense]|uniref:Chaperone required for assembly of F1-ATPase n=1 Tax=Phyllobacterium bourgognense TaxID=314236 RepID=A0A368Z122_9HYPH|nr:ATP12 family chaperone protein [Phyllobacterium bourgognense]RCW85609.1 chaperone required for assembly of F1-ATPase [Phyllobacterium bourgognense]